MRKTPILALTLLLAIIFITPLSASASSSAGIKPDSVFYFFDTAFEKINLFFIFSPEKKAKKALEYADERLAEAEAVANENKPEAVAKAMKNYQESVSLATEKSKELKDETKAKNLLSTIAENTSKHQETLAIVLEKVPEKAREAILKAIEVSKKGQEEALKQIAELKKEVSELKNEVKELKEELKNKDENNSDDKQDKEIQNLKKQIDELKQNQYQPKVIEKIIEKKIEAPKIKNVSLKIAQCEAKRDTDYSIFTVDVDQVITSTIQEIKTISQSKIDKYRQEYNICVNDVQTPEYNQNKTELTQLYSQIDTLEDDLRNRMSGFLVTDAQFRRQLAVEQEKLLTQIDKLERSINLAENKIADCAYYRDSVIQLESNYTNKLIKAIKDERESILTKEKLLFDREYQKCIAGL